MAEIIAEDVEMAVTGKTRVIMPTQLNGRTGDMDALQENSLITSTNYTNLH
ncbi:MAG: DegT/DnrJ/EryC1/StrS family aminotransferase [Deltaproteobacteria bacterium]|nr:DegT/DnrJ/EryC1/StrS family aminotransferase [Deltaproteobacteria bacterium]